MGVFVDAVDVLLLWKWLRRLLWQGHYSGTERPQREEDHSSSVQLLGGLVGAAELELQLEDRRKRKPHDMETRSFAALQVEVC